MEIEQNLLNSKLKTITAYYGSLVMEGAYEAQEEDGEDGEDRQEDTDEILGEGEGQAEDNDSCFVTEGMCDDRIEELETFGV